MKTVGFLTLVSVHDPFQSGPKKVEKSFHTFYCFGV